MSADSLIAELKKKLAQLANVPTGYDVENLRVLSAHGQINEATDLRPEEQTIIAEEMARGPDPITDGRPTVMRVVAWMCHEGVNRNRDAFVAEELAVATTKITARNPLVMDWNHAAVIGGPGRVIGTWTKADYAFDQKAKDGQGAWGILAEGVMFAWAYPEIADAMLAEQQRNGTVDFSMACIPSSVEFARDDKGSFAILHNPIFFTLSALDVPPGDPDAVGMVKEGDNADGVEDALKQELTAQFSTTGQAVESVSSWVPTGDNQFSAFAQLNGGTSAILTAALTGNTLTVTGNNVDGTGTNWIWTAPNDRQWWPVISAERPGVDYDAIQQMIAEALNRRTAQPASEDTNMPTPKIELSHTLDDKNNRIVVKAKVTVESETTEESLAIALPNAAARLTELETAVQGSMAEYRALEAQLRQVQTLYEEQAQVLATREGELAAANEVLAGYAAREEAVVRAQRLEIRKKQLPESYVAAHEALPDERKQQLESAWADMSDAAWADKVDDLKRAIPISPKLASYQERSKREGLLPLGTVDPDSIAGRCQKFTRLA
jgi:hypothetical protein